MTIWFIFIALVGSPAIAEPKCVNLALVGAVEIIARLEPKKYEATFQTFGMPAERIILVTNSEHSDSGRIIPPPHGPGLWVDNSKIENTTVMTKNGFKKKLKLIRESASCTKSGQKILAQQRAAAKAQEAVEKRAEADYKRKELELEKKREKEKAAQEALWE